MRIPNFLKTYPAFIIVTILLTVGITWLSTNPRTGTTTMKVEAVPSGSIIKINGKRAGEGTVTVPVGKLTIVVSHPGFKTSTKDLTIDSSTSHYYGVVLDQGTTTYAQWYAKNPDDSQKSEGISSKNFDEESRNASTQAPIVQALPFVSSSGNYRIDFGGSDTTTIFITAASPEYREAALTWIRTGGYDISDYRVTFVNKEPDSAGE